MNILSEGLSTPRKQQTTWTELRPQFENHWSNSLSTCAQVYVELQLFCIIPAAVRRDVTGIR